MFGRNPGGWLHSQSEVRKDRHRRLENRQMFHSNPVVWTSVTDFHIIIIMIQWWKLIASVPPRRLQLVPFVVPLIHETPRQERCWQEAHLAQEEWTQHGVHGVHSSCARCASCQHLSCLRDTLPWMDSRTDTNQEVDRTDHGRQAGASCRSNLPKILAWNTAQKLRARSTFTIHIKSSHDRRKQNKPWPFLLLGGQ